MLRTLSAFLAPLALVLPTATSADYVIADDVIIDGGGSEDQLCIGDNCTNPETYDLNAVKIKLKDESTSILFDDIDQTSWRLDANIGGLSRFRIVDQGNNTAPFDITAAAPTGSFFVAADGNIGLGTTIPVADLHITNNVYASIRLEKTGAPSRGWEIRASDDGFQVLDGGHVPFYIAADAPSWSLFVSAEGKAGIGTTQPQRDLHIASTAPNMRFETAGTGSPQTWDILAGNEAFVVSNVSAKQIPLFIASGAPDDALNISGTGDLGFGTALPAAAVHLARDTGTARMLIEETSATANPRTLLNLQNNGRPEIVMGNTATNGEWSFGAGTDFFLKTGAVGSLSSAKTKVFTVKSNGDTIVQGTLTTSGTTCGGGCDRVFTENAVIPAPDYAAQMWSQGHLPHVGPTVEGAPLNVSEKLGGMLNALEHAHVFIDRQTRRIDQQARQIAAMETAHETEIAALRAELTRLAARLDAQD